MLYGFDARNSLLLLPFLLYPFMFLIRIPDHQNTILAIIPDIAAMLAILGFFIRQGRRIRFNLMSMLLLVYAILNFINPAVHIFDAGALPYIFRQYVLPIIFTIVFLNASQKDGSLPQRALLLSIFSFSLVSVITLLNYLDIISIPPLFEEIYPYSSYILDIETGITHGRSIVGSEIIPRINLFIGGALGSAAAILVSLAIISLFNFVSRIGRGLAIVCGVLLMTAAFLSLSYTILLPVIFSIAVFTYKRINIIYGLPIAFALTFYLINSIDLAGMSAYQYLNEYIISSLYKLLTSNSIMAFLVGNGPKLTTSAYVYVTGSSAVDVGIFRILFEQGIVNFTFFIAIIIIVLKQFFWAVNNGFLIDKFPFILIFCTMLFSIHTNMTITPPFYPLFVLSMAGILLKGKNA